MVGRQKYDFCYFVSESEKKKKKNQNNINQIYIESDYSFYI